MAAPLVAAAHERAIDADADGCRYSILDENRCGLPDGIARLSLASTSMCRLRNEQVHREEGVFV